MHGGVPFVDKAFSLMLSWFGGLPPHLLGDSLISNLLKTSSNRTNLLFFFFWINVGGQKVQKRENYYTNDFKGGDLNYIIKKKKSYSRW